MNQCCSADFTAVIHIRRFKMVLLCERLDHLYVAVCHKLNASGKSSVALQLLAKVVSSEIFFMPRDFLRCLKNSFQKGMCLLCLSLYGSLGRWNEKKWHNDVVYSTLQSWNMQDFPATLAVVPSNSRNGDRFLLFVGAGRLSEGGFSVPSSDNSPVSHHPWGCQQGQSWRFLAELMLLLR